MDNKQNESIYQTGHTSPPKSHSGVIAVLLVLVIFLGGIVSALGLMNIRLFHKLQSQEEREMVFATVDTVRRELPQAVAMDLDGCLPGLEVRTLSPFYSRYFGLSQGLYVTDIDPQSVCYVQGLRAGDILTALDGVCFGDTDTLQQLLDNCSGTMAISFVRDGQPQELHLLLEP